MKTPLPSTNEVTELLLAWSNGEKSALERLAPLVYEELHRLAHHYMSRERPDHTLQTSALVNEAYLRLVDQKRVQCQNRAHFFAISAQLMRQILINHAQSRRCLKRGRGARKVSLDEAIIVSEERGEDVLALDDALNELAKVDPRKSKVVELRFFGGLSVEESAEALDVSPVTIMREWRLARAWLYRELGNEG
jgi:RNA polymerase sigma factor (TIGR02999 family)